MSSQLEALTLIPFSALAIVSLLSMARLASSFCVQSRAFRRRRVLT